MTAGVQPHSHFHLQLLLLNVHHVPNIIVQYTAAHANVHTSRVGKGRMRLVPNILQHRDGPEKRFLCTVNV